MEKSVFLKTMNKFGQSGGSPTGSLLKQTFASKANVPFSNGTSTSQRERSLHKGNVPFSNGTFASQMERSLPKGNVRFSKGMFFIFQMRVKT